MTRAVHDAVPQYRYVLEVLQQPKRARAMAFGERDRRPVDPCPIVKLRVFGPDGAEDDQVLWDNPLIMHAALFDQTGNVERSMAYSTYDTTTTSTAAAAAGVQPSTESPSTIVETTRAYQIPTMHEAMPIPETSSEAATRLQPPPLRPTELPAGSMLPGREGDDAVAQQFQEPAEPEEAVMGMLVSAPFHLRDLDDQLGCYYCFPDIRVRHPGKYSLRFSLMRMPSTEPATTEPENILEYVFSTAFTVYTLKDFPGVDESTPLSKKFALQGVGIPIRNKTRLKADAEDATSFE